MICILNYAVKHKPSYENNMSVKKSIFIKELFQAFKIESVEPEQEHLLICWNSRSFQRTIPVSVLKLQIYVHYSPLIMIKLIIT